MARSLLTLAEAGCGGQLLLIGMKLVKTEQSGGKHTSSSISSFEIRKHWSGVVLMGGGGNERLESNDVHDERALNPLNLKAALHGPSDDVHSSFTPSLALTLREAWSWYDRDRKPTEVMEVPRI